MKAQEQFQEYYNNYQGMVRSLCLGFTKGAEAEADDLVQETFIKIWAALSKFEGRSAPKTWIYRICVNTCLLHVRKSGNKKAEKLRLDHVQIPDEQSPEKNYKELYEAIGQLKELDRIIITLVLDEVPYLEIAEITGLTEGNVRVKINRIKQQLNKILNQNGR